jgi:hypothetical protein
VIGVYIFLGFDEERLMLTSFVLFVGDIFLFFDFWVGVNERF